LPAAAGRVMMPHPLPDLPETRRRMPPRFLLAASAALVALVAAGAPLAGQSVARPAPRFGLMAGVSIASLSGDDTEDLDSRTGFVAGGTLTLPLTALVSFQPELLYAQKGAKASESGFSATIKLDYIEVPLLLRVDVPTTGSTVRPHFYAGPAVAFKARCDLEASGSGIDASQSCSDAAAEDDGEDVKSVDAGLVLGGGLGFDLGRQRLNVGARYNLGLLNIAPEGQATTRTRALTIYGSLDFPIGR